MGKIIINKYIKADLSQDVSNEVIGKFTKRVDKDNNRYSDGEFIIVHDKNAKEDPKVAILSNEKVTFIGEGGGNYTPGDSSISIEKDPDIKENSIKVKISENGPGNNMLVLNEDGLFVKEDTIIDCGEY